MCVGCSLLLGGCFPEPLPCQWNAQALTWFDDNGNGARDPGEPPAPGVLIYGDYAGERTLGDRTSYLTDSHGQALFTIGGCDEAAKEGYGINALAPRGYHFTTAARIPVSGNLGLTGGSPGLMKPLPPFAFGFTHDDQVTPVVARRAFKACQSFHFANSWGGELGGDGTLWAEGLDEEGHYALVHFVAGQKPQSYAPFSRIRDLAIGSEGEVWTAIAGGVARLDATGWRVYTTTHGLPDQADEVAVGADGTVWARVQGDVRRLDPAGDRWLSCPDDILRPQGGLPEFIQAAGGPLYLVSLRGAAELAAPESAGESGSCVVRHLGGSFSATYRGYAVIPAADGTFWGHGAGQEPGPTLIHYDPATQQSFVYTYRSTGGAMAFTGIGSLMPAADGTVWIGTTGQSVFHLVPDAESGTWEQYALADGTTDGWISQIAVASNGAVWLLEGQKQRVDYCAGWE